jgi:hypothetical protein
LFGTVIQEVGNDKTCCYCTDIIIHTSVCDVELPAEVKVKLEALGIDAVTAEKSPVEGIYSVFLKKVPVTSLLTVLTYLPVIYSG